MAARRAGDLAVSIPVSRETVVGALVGTGVVAVVRVDNPRNLVDLSRALAEGGVRHVEITMTTPSALEVIAEASVEVGSDAYVGAGTVLDAETARRAIAAGARFIVGPVLDLDVIATAKEQRVAVIPGCLTPTEIVTAWSHGADIVKVFPGRVATPGYFADLRGPFPQMRLMPTGNVDLSTAPEYIRAGAVAIGVGKALVDMAALNMGDWETITNRAREFVRVVAETRSAQ